MMDVAELERTKAAIEADYTTRYGVERMEQWRTIAGEMPYMPFPRDWEVAIIPPFGGAVARFWVRKGEAHVSIYADFYERLGCWDEPHWEIYPDANDDNARFSIATETSAMLHAIKLSLAKQLRAAKRAAQGTEARRAETSSGSVHDGPVGETDAPKEQQS